MDPNKRMDGTKAVSEEDPPSYNEAMKNQPLYPTASYSTAPRPTAPGLKSTDSTNPPSQHSQPPPPGFVLPTNDSNQSNQNFEKWDDRATRTFIIHRLQMQEQFNQAKSSQEKDLLWNLLLNELLDLGYHFTVFDIISFWEFQFRIYMSILENLAGAAASASSHSTDWEYFQPMHNVFKSHSASELADVIPSSSTSILPTSSGISNTPMIVPITTPLPPSEPNQVSEKPEVPSTSLQNPEIPSSSNVPSDDHVTSTLLPTITAPAETPKPGWLVGSSIPNGAGSSSLNPDANGSVTEAAAGVGDLTSIQNTFPSTEAAPNLLNDSANGGVELSAITTQPEGFSVTKFLSDNNVEDVVTSQPVSSPTLLAEIPTTRHNSTDDGCCCNDSFWLGCCLGSTHGHYHCPRDNIDEPHTHVAEDACCCESDGCGGGCCDGDSGGGSCCDGDAGCCDAGGDCDGCDVDCDSC